MSKSKAPNPYDGIPDTVQVGAYTFKVVVMGGADGDNDRLYGDMNPPRQRIRVGPHLTGQRLANTFLHECLHAIHDFWGVTDDTNEENTTYLTTNGLCAFWQANPAACAWWARINAMPVEVKP